MVASITSFLIGAPIGLVVLATFSKEREDSATLERVNKLSKHAWYSYRDLVLSYCSDERRTALQEKVRDVTDSHRKAAQLRQQLFEIMANEENIKVYYEPLLMATANSAEEYYGRFRKAVYDAQTAIDRNFRLENEWASIQGAWQTLDQFIRLQRLEQGLKWFSAEADGGIRRWMNSASGPLQEFMDVHGYGLGPMSVLGKGGRTMFSAIETFHSDIDSLGPYESPVPLYEARRAAAYNFMNDLTRHIYIVEMEQWPESESKPTVDDSQVFEATPHRVLALLASPEGEAEWYRAAALFYHKKLRRRPEGNMSGPEMRALAKEREKAARDDV